MTIFKHKNTVRMYDTDAAGILYFASQFRFSFPSYNSLPVKWIALNKSECLGAES